MESRRKVVNYIAMLVLKCHYLHICFALSAQPPTTMNFISIPKSFSFFIFFFRGAWKIFPVMKLWKRFILLLNAFNVAHSTAHRKKSLRQLRANECEEVPKKWFLWLQSIVHELNAL
jgi:hypothetical protein